MYIILGLRIERGVRWGTMRADALGPRWLYWRLLERDAATKTITSPRAYVSPAEPTPVGAGEVVDHLRGRHARVRVAYVVGQLQVADHAAVFVAPLGLTQVHAYALAQHG
jgi:hypothetical protein